jgi:tetratricopeptide (TPR) repeat protein
MAHPSFVDAYLEQADYLANGRIPLPSLPLTAAHLPSLDGPLLDALAAQATRISLTEPKRGWALTAVAEASAAHVQDPFLQALANWHVARAANAWYRPDLVATAVARARRYFNQSDVTAESGWLAACDWQQYAEPWLHNGFQTAITTLENALVQLADSPLSSLVPYCRLSLAYGYILTTRYEAAIIQLDESEALFQQQGDLLHQARGWLHRASAMRRQLHYPEAISLLDRAQQIFRQVDAPLDGAKAAYQLGYCEWNQSGDFTRAEQLFATAAAQFGEQEVDLWQALCLNGLVQVYNNGGRLAEAYRLLATIRETYARFPLIGLQADTAIESGIQSLYRGDWQTAVTYLQQAEANYSQLNLAYMVAMSAVYQAEAYARASHYHQALRCLERALTDFERLNDDGRQAECQMRLGQVWLELGRDDLAYHCLAAAADYFERAQEPAFFKAVLTIQAEILFRQQKFAPGIELLRRALALAESRGNPLHHAMARRTLGEALCLAGELAEGGQLCKRPWPILRR